DEILPAEEQPLPAAASPTADSPGYVPESDPKEEPKEDDEDPEEDPADYPADRDDDDDDDEDEDEEEEEEHLAPANSVPPVHRMTAWISIRDEPSISLPPRQEVERLLALTTPPPSPLTPLSSPLPHIPSSPLPIPSPPPNSPTHIEIPESCLPLQKRVRFAFPTPSHEVEDRPAIARDDPYFIAREDLYGFVNIVDVPPRCSTSRELDYGIMDAWVDLVGAIDEIAPTTLEGVNQRVTDLSTVVEQETTIMYGIMEDAQDDRSQGDKVASELLASDHKRQVQLTKTLRLLKGLQTQMVEFQRQHGPAKGLGKLMQPGRSFVQAMIKKALLTASQHWQHVKPPGIGMMPYFKNGCQKAYRHNATDLVILARDCKNPPNAITGAIRGLVLNGAQGAFQEGLP
ncbi:hypothetical protein Tco_0374669, partial [Tanacetum coccineum]